MRRTEKLPPVRLSKLEKARIQENAAASGLSVSEFVRQRTCGELGDLRPPVQGMAERPEPDDFETRVREYARTMPRRSAEIAVRRELAAERAKAALASA